MADTPSMEELLKQLINLVRQGNELAQQNIRETRQIQSRLDNNEQLTDLFRQALSEVQGLNRDMPKVKKTLKIHGVKLKKLAASVDWLEREARK